MATLPATYALLAYIGAGFYPGYSPNSRSIAAVEVLVDSIAMVESGGNHRAVGDHGRARGAWQLWSVAWIDANRQLKKEGLPTYPYGDYQNPRASRQVAIAYLRLCRERLLAAGVSDPSPEQYYLCFSMGFSAFKDAGFDPARCPAKKVDAADRVRNLFDRATR